ncbi:hypothetical protein GCM10010492_53090 [Saccharothrix mutabilis subsp. mutabilis]|uniref:PqqD family protein n=1 Tax=Saccharothrix mutabilis subsp. mutabilis TaxID=66855 RepID=A0ABN0UDE2_9PSEU
MRTSGWELEPYADLSAAFVFVREPFSVSVLDRLTWYVLELCDGSPRDAVVQRLADVMGAGPERAGQVVDSQVAMLRRHGLVERAA